MRQGRAQALVGGLALVGIALAAAALYAGREPAARRLRRAYDYSGRSGFPRPAEQMRGAARMTRSPTGASSPSFASPVSVPGA